ncbi:MAG: DUF805 domain-containing protein [Actinomycetes bacterium]
MGFGEAIKTVFGKFAKMEGRASRPEFWWWILLLFILQIISNILDGLFGLKINYAASGAVSTNINNVGWLSLIVALIFIIPTICVSVRRLHDTDRSGWWWWLNVICCIGGLILFIFYLQPSTPGPNRYGPDSSGGSVS